MKRTTTALFPERMKRKVEQQHSHKEKIKQKETKKKTTKNNKTKQNKTKEKKTKKKKKKMQTNTTSPNNSNLVLRSHERTNRQQQQSQIKKTSLKSDVLSPNQNPNAFFFG